MNFLKYIVCVIIIFNNCIMTASWFSDNKKQKKINILSAKFGFEKGKFYASVEEEPSLFRKAFGMKGIEHKVETVSLIPKEQITMSRSLNIDIKGKSIKKDDVDGLLSCCGAIMEDCCGKITKED